MGVAKGANLLPGNGQMRMKQMSETIGIVTYAPPRLWSTASYYIRLCGNIAPAATPSMTLLWAALWICTESSTATRTSCSARCPI
jgi:hypothetical protein